MLFGQTKHSELLAGENLPRGQGEQVSLPASELLLPSLHGRQMELNCPLYLPFGQTKHSELFAGENLPGRQTEQVSLPALEL